MASTKSNITRDLDQDRSFVLSRAHQLAFDKLFPDVYNLDSELIPLVRPANWYLAG